MDTDGHPTCKLESEKEREERVKYFSSSMRRCFVFCCHCMYVIVYIYISFPETRTSVFVTRIYTAAAIELDQGRHVRIIDKLCRVLSFFGCIGFEL